jgi:hypothetical protein
VTNRLLLLAVALGIVGAPSANAETRVLVGTVGPGFTIGLADAAGTPVEAVPAGRYEFVVHDLSDIHNFVLGKKATGERPVQTEVEFVGDKSFTVDLTRGLWVYACSPHFQTMFGRLTVLSGKPVQTPPRRLTATVTSRRVAVAPRRVAPGRFVVTVRDRSASRGFHLVGPAIDRRTGKAFTGTATWRLRLRTGTYRFGDERRLSGRLVVR